MAHAVAGLGRVRSSQLGSRAGAPQAVALQVSEPRQACTVPLSAHRHILDVASASNS